MRAHHICPRPQHRTTLQCRNSCVGIGIYRAGMKGLAMCAGSLEALKKRNKGAGALGVCEQIVAACRMA